MLTLRFDRGPRPLRFRATTPIGVLVLIVGYFAVWAGSGQRLATSEAERAIRAHLVSELQTRQRATSGMSTQTADPETLARWGAEQAALDSAVIVRLDLRHSLLDRPLSSRARWLARVRFSGGVVPAERYFRLRASGLATPVFASDADAWEWRWRF